MGTVAPATTFPGGPQCSDWGGMLEVSNGTVSESNGTLTLTPNANVDGAVAYCLRTGVTLTSLGMFTEVTSALHLGWTRLEIDSAGVTYYVGVTDAFIEGGALPGFAGRNGDYDSIAMRWWRILFDTGEVVFQFSADGHAWTDIDRGPAPEPHAAVDVRVLVRTPTALPAPGSATFESVNVCPP